MGGQYGPPRSAGHPFYQRLNRVLDDAGFDAFVEEQCATFYADGVGRTRTNQYYLPCADQRYATIQDRRAALARGES